MPAIHNKVALLNAQEIRVYRNGEEVVVQIGNAKLNFSYEEALKFSQHVRLVAKDAKNFAGDTSRHWSVLGILQGVKL